MLKNVDFASEIYLNKKSNTSNNSNNSSKIKFTSVPDSFEKSNVKTDKSNDGKFSFSEAVKNFGKGIISPLKALVQHPLISLAMVGATVGVCSVVPVLAPLMTLGFGAVSVAQLGKGAVNAMKNYKNGNYDQAEKSFDKIGQGFVGTLMTALGIKQSAQVAAEAKAASKLKVTSFESFQKEQIANSVSKGSWLDNLKEITSLITTKAGRQAVKYQFTPSVLRARYNTVKNSITEKLLQLKGKEKSNVKLTNIEEFKKSPEGIRRAGLTDEQIEAEVTGLYNKAFDELGIPIEQRPDLIFEKADSLAAGYYSRSRHKLNFNPESYRSGVSEMADVMMHEATHCKEALLRARLPKDKANQIVKDQLINRILNGESEEIILNGGFIAPEMMTPPKMSPKMKTEFSKLAKEYFYTGDSDFASNLLSYVDMSYCKKSGSPLFDATKFSKSQKELQPLLNKLQKIINDNPDFTAQYSSADEALNVLSKYSLSHSTRYNAFTDTSVRGLKNLPELSASELAEAEKSLVDIIASIEGNARISGFNGATAGRKGFNQYQFSPEEVLAQQKGNKFLINELTAKMSKMKNAGTLSGTDEAFITKLIEKANLTIEYKTKGANYYESYTSLINNPSDVSLKNSVKLLEKDLASLETKINKCNEFISKLGTLENLSMMLPPNIVALLNELN